MGRLEPREYAFQNPAKNRSVRVSKNRSSTSSVPFGSAAISAERTHDRARHPEEIPSTADLFEIIRTTRSMRAGEAGRGAERRDPKDPGGRRVCAERRQNAALAAICTVLRLAL
jgi:hypothetical protein